MSLYPFFTKNKEFFELDVKPKMREVRINHTKVPNSFVGKKESIDLHKGSEIFTKTYLRKNLAWRLPGMDRMLAAVDVFIDVEILESEEYLANPPAWEEKFSGEYSPWLFTYGSRVKENHLEIVT